MTERLSLPRDRSGRAVTHGDEVIRVAVVCPPCKAAGRQAPVFRLRISIRRDRLSRRYGTSTLPSPARSKRRSHTDWCPPRVGHTRADAVPTSLTNQIVITSVRNDDCDAWGAGASGSRTERTPSARSALDPHSDPPCLNDMRTSNALTSHVSVREFSSVRSRAGRVVCRACRACQHVPRVLHIHKSPCGPSVARPIARRRQVALMRNGRA
jgi:hypothetical protein